MLVVSINKILKQRGSPPPPAPPEGQPSNTLSAQSLHSSLLLSPIPLDTLLQPHPGSAKTIECTADGEVDLALAQTLDHLQVREVAAAAGVRHGDAAPLGQLGDELLVHAALEALVVGCVDKKLGAVWL